MNSSKECISQRGFSSLFLVIGIIAAILLIVVIVGYIGLKPGGFIIKSIVENTPSQTTSVPFEKWLTFESTDPKFSVKYPSDWVYRKVESSNSFILLSFGFMAKDAFGSPVMILVMDKKGADTVQDWVDKYTTSFKKDDPETDGKDYAQYNVSDTSNTKVGNKDVVKFYKNNGDGTKTEGYFMMSDKYVFLFATEGDKSADIKNRIIESLTF